MSGGVDSSVAAALLFEAGYEVVGITMRVLPASRPTAENARPDPVVAAQAVATRLGIPHRVAEVAARFEEDVIAPFVAEYAAGRTPNPCVRCNRRIKFGALWELAEAAGARYLATGHYARVERGSDRTLLRRACHRPKDQSYVLAGLSQPQLSRALFPLGGLAKSDVRAKAETLGLPCVEAAESQEICFIPGDDYRAFLAKRLGTPKPGPIYSTRGEILGEHKGLFCYTVGQRKGLGIAAPRPYYVVALDPARNAVIVAHEEETYCTGFLTADVNWCSISAQEAPFECFVQIRYLHTPVPATVGVTDNGLEVRFHTPVRAVTPGQWAVCYDSEDYVLAAGTIDPGSRRLYGIGHPAEE